jgi:hypothetical protein
MNATYKNIITNEPEQQKAIEARAYLADHIGSSENIIIHR